jgi:phospholipid-translocating ATPase
MKHFEIIVETPNDIISRFDGLLQETNAQKDQILSSHSISIENAVWSNCRIEYSSIIAQVVYVGNNTKLMQSMVTIGPKRSKFDDELNFLSKLLFLIMLAGAAVLTVIKGLQDQWYLQLFRYILLLGTIIPLSMKVNQDLSKIFFANRINGDKEIPGTLSRNSFIAEDLARVEYVLADKTGTLTKNKMTMKNLALPEVNLNVGEIDNLKQMVLNTSKFGLDFERNITL